MLKSFSPYRVPCRIALSALLISSFYSCSSSGDKKAGPYQPAEDALNVLSETRPFKITAPKGWTRVDTVLQGMKGIILFSPDEQYRPMISVSTEPTGSRFHQEYVAACREELLKGLPGAQLEGKEGRLTVGNNTCIWFAYTFGNNGTVERERVFYSIKIQNVSYNFTAGTFPGGMKKYRPVFDSVVSSFRLDI